MFLLLSCSSLYSQLYCQFIVINIDGITVTFNSYQCRWTLMNNCLIFNHTIYPYLILCYSWYYVTEHTVHAKVRQIQTDRLWTCFFIGNFVIADNSFYNVQYYSVAFFINFIMQQFGSLPGLLVTKLYWDSNCLVFLGLLNEAYSTHEYRY